MQRWCSGVVRISLNETRLAGISRKPGNAERGILICGQRGRVVDAGKQIQGIRAGLCHDRYSAHQGVEHDDMNVPVMGARIIGPMMAQNTAEAFLNAKFSGGDRHVRRLNKVKGIEQDEFR